MQLNDEPIYSIYELQNTKLLKKITVQRDSRAIDYLLDDAFRETLRSAKFYHKIQVVE